MGNPETQNHSEQLQQNEQQVRYRSLESDQATQGFISSVFNEGPYQNLDFQNPERGKQKDLVQACEEVYANGQYGADFFRIMATNSSISSLPDELLAEYTISLSQELKKLDRDKTEEEVYITDGEISTSLENLSNYLTTNADGSSSLVAGYRESVQQDVVDHIQTQQDETVMNSELWEGYSKLSKKNQELIEQAHDGTTAGLIKKFGEEYLDEANNMSTGMIMGWRTQKMNKFMTAEQEVTTDAEPGEGGGFISGLMGGDGLSRADMERIYATGPLGLNANEVVSFETKGKIDDFDSMINRISNTIATCESKRDANGNLPADVREMRGHPVLKDPRIFDHVLSFIVDKDPNALKELNTALTSENIVALSIDNDTPIDQALEAIFAGFDQIDIDEDTGIIESLNEELGTVDVSGLSRESQQAVGQLVDGMKKIKGGGNFMDGIRDAWRGIDAIAGPVIKELSAIFGMEDLGDFFEDITLQIDGGLNTTQQSAMSAGVGLISSAVLGKSVLGPSGHYEITNVENRDVMIDSITDSFFSDPSELHNTLGLDDRTVNKLFRKAHPDVKKVRPNRQITDLLVFNMKNIIAPGSGKTEFTDDKRTVSDTGDALYGSQTSLDESQRYLRSLVQQYVDNRSQALSGEYATENITAQQWMESLVSGMIKDANASEHVIFRNADRRSTIARQQNEQLTAQQEAQLDAKAQGIVSDSEVAAALGTHTIAYDHATKRYTLTNSEDPTETAVIPRSDIMKESTPDPAKPNEKVNEPDATTLATIITKKVSDFNTPSTGIEKTKDDNAQKVLQKEEIKQAVGDHIITYNHSTDIYMMKNNDDVSKTGEIEYDDVTLDGEVHIPTLITKITEVKNSREETEE